MRHEVPVTTLPKSQHTPQSQAGAPPKSPRRVEREDQALPVYLGQNIRGASLCAAFDGFIEGVGRSHLHKNDCQRTCKRIQCFFHTQRF